MSDMSFDDLSQRELAMVVELQQVELKRLLAEHRRLNERIDTLLNLQEREQVLRQQMQTALDRLAEQRAISGSTTAPAPAPQLERRLHRTESRFRALQSAVGLLVDLIEKRETVSPEPEPPRPLGPHADGPDGGGHVRIFAPNAPEMS